MNHENQEIAAGEVLEAIEKLKGVKAYGNPGSKKTEKDQQIIIHKLPTKKLKSKANYCSKVFLTC